MSTVLDQIVHRLQNMPAFTLYAVTGDGELETWYDVGGDIVKDLVINELALAEQVQSVGAQIAHWGRLAAQARRVWQIREREYRIWRDGYYLEWHQRALDDPDKKKITAKELDCMGRVHPEYKAKYNLMEEAEESYNAAVAIVEGFKAKRDMLRASVYRAREDSQPRLSV